jgi:hypothetical protein
MAVLIVVLSATTAACDDGRADTPSAGATTAARATTAAQPSDAATDDGASDGGASPGAGSYCMTAAGVVSLQSDLLIALADGDPSAYQVEVDAIDPSAAPVEIADSIQKIRDLDEQYVADGQQASVSQDDLNDAIKPVADWLGTSCG